MYFFANLPPPFFSAFLAQCAKFRRYGGVVVEEVQADYLAQCARFQQYGGKGAGNTLHSETLFLKRRSEKTSPINGDF